MVTVCLNDVKLRIQWNPVAFLPPGRPLFQTDSGGDKGVSDVSLAGIVLQHCSQNRYFKLHRSKEIVSDCIILLCTTMGGMRETANSLKTKLKSEEATKATH